MRGTSTAPLHRISLNGVFDGSTVNPGTLLKTDEMPSSTRHSIWLPPSCESYITGYRFRDRHKGAPDTRSECVTPGFAERSGPGLGIDKRCQR
jgi:hypothetical protein